MADTLYVLMKRIDGAKRYYKGGAWIQDIRAARMYTSEAIAQRRANEMGAEVEKFTVTHNAMDYWKQ